MASAIIILNVGSGSRGKAKRARELRDLALKIGVDCDIVVARSGGQLAAAAKRAAESPYERVIAAGGDGTINAVASALIGTDKALGILPLGTFNYLARDLGIPLELEPAFRACFQDETCPLTVGEVNGRIFLNNASLGLYPIVLSVREQAYRKWGRSKAVAYWSVVKALLRRANMSLTITAEGRTWEARTPLMFIARNSFQLQEFQLPGIRCVNDSGFSVYILPPSNKLGLVRFAWRVLTRRLQPFSDFEVLCTDQLRVESRRILRTIAFDGERAKALAPLEFRVHRDALRVLVSKTKGKEHAA